MSGELRHVKQTFQVHQAEHEVDSHQIYLGEKKVFRFHIKMLAHLHNLHWPFLL